MRPSIRSGSTQRQVPPANPIRITECRGWNQNDLGKLVVRTTVESDINLEGVIWTVYLNGEVHESFSTGSDFESGETRNVGIQVDWPVEVGEYTVGAAATWNLYGAGPPQDPEVTCGNKLTIGSPGNGGNGGNGGGNGGGPLPGLQLSGMQIFLLLVVLGSAGYFLTQRGN